MTVFCTWSYRGQKESPQTYEALIDTLESFKSIQVISPYLKNTYQPLVEAVTGKSDLESRYAGYQAMRKGIRLADAVIFETSTESFQIGHEVSYALTLKKPTFCLSQHEDFSQRIEHDYFFGSRYNLTNLKPKIQDFLAAARDMTQSERFNLFLYPHQVEYLKLESQKHGMNMSEYMRFLINHDRSQE